MPIDLMRANRLPAPLNAFTTGNATNPFPVPGDKEYEALTKIARKASPKTLLALLDDSALDTGANLWDDAAKKKLAVGARSAFEKHSSTRRSSRRETSARCGRTWAIDRQV